MMVLASFVPSTVELDGLTLTPSKNGLLKETQREFELMTHVAQWEAFTCAVISKYIFAHEDTSLPRHIYFFTIFTAADFGSIRMLIKGYMNEM
jgi:hypothetical protein